MAKKKEKVKNWEQTSMDRTSKQFLKDKQIYCIKHYGFVANPAKTIKQNVHYQLLQMNVNSFFKHNICTKFHNLTKNTKLPLGTASLLGLGSKFCIETRLPPSNLKNTFISLTRSIRLQAWINEELKDRQDDFTHGKNNLYVKNSNFIPPPASTHIENAHNHFRLQLISLLNNKQTKPEYNLTKLQRLAIKQIKGYDNIIIMDADKNLGIVVMKREDYIKSILKEHLLKQEIYDQLSYPQAHHKLKIVETEIKKIVLNNNQELSTSDKSFFIRSFQLQHRIPTFYGMPKLHKKRIGNSYKTRPVVAKIGSFIEIASKYCDYYLSKLIPHVKSYLKDSFSLLKDLNNFPSLPESAKLLTADAVSMYTNIDTNHGLQILSEFIYSHATTDNTFPTKTLIKLLTLVMKNNIFTFGDLYFLQKCGTAMGTIVAVKYATIYYASHENNTLIPKYQRQMLYYKRYIDDIFIIWLPGRLTWEDLQRDLAFGRMTWTMEKPKKETHFLDLTIKINEKNKITHKTYEKPLNLHHYLPTNSAHPPGTFKSLVVGFLRRYWLMNSDTKNYINQITKFAERLNKRGYTKEIIHKTFHEASIHLQQKMKFRKVFVRAKNESSNNKNKILFFKRTFHPKSLPNKSLQKAYSDSLGKIKLFDKMIVCNKRPKNLRDTLMPSSLKNIPGKNPSDFVPEMSNNT